jgi:hypothetical protein
MKCAERNRLWAEFKARLAELNENVDRICSLDVGGIFNDAVVAAQQTSRDCDRAQLLWEEHMREHRCAVQCCIANEKTDRQWDEADQQRSKRKRA